MPIPRPTRAMGVLAICEIQRRLAAAGYDVGTIDGVAGPRTLAAHAAYVRDTTTPLDDLSPMGDAAAAYAIAYARGLIGPHETKGKNRGPLPDALACWAGGQPDGAAWCARFAWHCVDVGARTDGRRLARKQTSGGVAKSYERALAPITSTQIRDGHTVPVGSLICRVAPGATTGLVELLCVEWGADTAWAHTIGGNTSSGLADRDGQGVWEHELFIRRDAADLLGAIVPVVARL